MHSGRNRNKPGSFSAMKDQFSGRRAGSSEFPSTPWVRPPFQTRTKRRRSHASEISSLPDKCLVRIAQKDLNSVRYLKWSFRGSRTRLRLCPRNLQGRKSQTTCLYPSHPRRARTIVLRPRVSGALALMVVSLTKSPFPILTEAQRPVTPRSIGTQLGAGSSPLTSQFGDGGGLGLADLDVRDDAEGDGMN